MAHGGLEVSPAPLGPEKGTRSTTECSLVAFGTVQASLEAVSALRHKPGLVGTPPLAANFLKYSDEQTVVGLAAVFRALHDFRLQTQSFRDWGIVAAPGCLGRVAVAEALHKCREGGALKAPPMIIPHRSLHSTSATIGQALRSHGPNFGIGGGPGHILQGFLAGLAILEERRLPGLWIVLTHWEPEPLPTLEGSSLVSATCHAVALACVPTSSAGSGLRLKLDLMGGGAEEANLFLPAETHQEEPNLTALAYFLTHSGINKQTQGRFFPLPGGARLELTG